MNHRIIRKKFPHLEDMIYLGAAGKAPFNLVLYNAVQECWNRRRYGSDLGGTDHSWFSSKEPQTRNEAANLINSDPDELCHVNRVVQGLNMVKNILDYNSSWKKGDNIVLTDQAYPSTGHTFLSLRKKGVEIRVVKNRKGRIMQHDMEKMVDENTRLVVINRTSVGSGFTYDVERVSEIAHKVGAYVVDDAIQTIGSKVIDVQSDDVDFLVTGSYKWLCGPPEAGFLYIKKEICGKLEPHYWSYINVDKGPRFTGMEKFPFGALDHDSIKSYDYPFPQSAQRFEPGTIATDQLWGWHAVLKWLNELGKENIESRNLKLGYYLSEKLESIGLIVQTPSDPEPDALNTHRHALTMYTTGAYKKDNKSVEMLKKGALRPVKGPTMKYQGGFGGVRVSPHFYNTFKEIDLFIETLKRILERI